MKRRTVKSGAKEDMGHDMVKSEFGKVRIYFYSYNNQFYSSLSLSSLSLCKMNEYRMYMYTNPWSRAV